MDVGPQLINSIISCIDLTTLEGTDNEARISELCFKARETKNRLYGSPYVAAVCVYPVFVKLARELLKDTGIKVASVAGGFPSGQIPLEIKLAELKYALDQGADEIDMVLSRGKFLEGDYASVEKEIISFKEVCGQKHLKVIIETGELGSNENVLKASELAIRAGADFLKTSTGKVKPAADPESFKVMINTIRSHYITTGKKIGIKAAGGISSYENAFMYYTMASSILGPEYLSKSLFRIGASSLLDNLIKELKQ